MLQLTKIFHFEMAHAIDGYAGACKNIHGHSYELHVTISGENPMDQYLPSTGFLIDFKELKQLVREAVIEKLDHKIVLSQVFLSNNSGLQSLENIIVWPVEPSAENILIFIRNTLQKIVPAGVILSGLRLYETKDSFAEWKL